MRKVIKIDSNGYFVEDVILESEEITPIDCIEIECHEGFYKPKWNGSRWIEGLTQEEIEELKNKPVPKTELEILKETVEELVLANLGV